MSSRVFLILMAIAAALGFAYALSGCAHQPELKQYDTNHTRKFFCEEESCPAFTRLHNYTLLLSSYDADSKECVCKVMSDFSPDAWEVRIPIDAPADSPADSL